MRVSGFKMLALCGVTALALGACGDDDKKSPPKDTTQQNDTAGNDTAGNDTSGNDTSGNDTSGNDTSGNDTTGNDTAGNDTAGNDTAGPACDNTGFTGTAYMDMENYEDYGSFSFGLENETGYVSVESYDGPITGVGTYPLGATEDDKNYETCSLCVLVHSECTTTGCAKSFFATTGSIEVTAIDLDAGSVTARLVGVELEQVTIDTANQYHSTPVPNGESWCMDGVSIEVAGPECTTNTECTDPARPICTDDGACVQCDGFFDCQDTATPVCQFSTGTCVADASLCQNDDALEPNNSPKTAKPLTLGTPIEAKTCKGSTRDREFDWYTFTTTATMNIELSVAHSLTGEPDFEIALLNAAGEVLESPQSEDNPEVISLALVPAGTYYVLVYLYDGSQTDAIAYTLSGTAVAPECTTNTDCTNPAKAFCDPDAGVCVACVDSFSCTATAPLCLAGADDAPVCGSSDVCTGDDTTREPNDDGPKGASAITLGETITSQICGDSEAASSDEADWFTFTLTEATSVRVTLTWTAANDLDVFLVSATGEGLGGAYTTGTTGPETFDKATLAAGTYFLVVNSYTGDGAVSIDYSLKLESF